MTSLLDVNVLLALFDRWHVNHSTAHQWFGDSGRFDWATCSQTELGLIRVLSNPAFPGLSLTPREATTRLARFCAAGGHHFWPDDVAPRVSLDGELRMHLQGHKQVTDFHLAALADRYGGQLVTLDGRLVRSLRGTHLESAVLWVR